MKVLALVQVLLWLEADKYNYTALRQFDLSSFLVTLALNSICLTYALPKIVISILKGIHILFQAVSFLHDYQIHLNALYYLNAFLHT